MQDPSRSDNRPFFGWRAGIFSPSRRQIRATRLSSTNQPAAISNAPVFR